MKRTREIILDTALHLFNAEGLSQVKLRTIANAMGISQGNLNYHFKKRVDVIEALYFRLVDLINEHLSTQSEGENLLEVLFGMSQMVMEDLYTYRFIMLDFTQVMRENRKIKKHFQQLKTHREFQFMGFFKLLVDAGLMRSEVLPNEYKNLFKRLQLLGDFWLPAAEIDRKKISKKSISEYAEVINQTIYPYLTKRGEEKYHQIAKI